MAGRYAETLGSGLYGIDATLVRIEVSIQNGIPSFDLVGLVGSDVREARDRVRAAVRNSGFEFPSGRITANFAPAWIQKEGTGFDLPLALAVLTASGQIPPVKPGSKVLSFGELSLTGEVHGVNGAVNRAGLALNFGIDSVLVPEENRREVAMLPGLRILPVRTLRDAIENAAGRGREECDEAGPFPDEARRPPNVPSQVHGQLQALGAVEIAAAGMHNLLLVGSPGSGKTLLATLLPYLLPELDAMESLEVTRIYSAAGLLPPGQGRVVVRPFRAPHHTATAATLVGGGGRPKPGEATLAHKGVLFLDELSEFKAGALESLRTPSEERVVRMSRNASQLVFPAEFVLVGASNPCPCGLRFEPKGGCRCNGVSVRRYVSRIGGPLIDRMDLQVEVRQVPAESLEETVRDEGREALVALKVRVAKAAAFQKARNADILGTPCWNSRIPGDRIESVLSADPGTVRKAAVIAEAHRLSVRSFQKMLRVSRTVADLEGSERVAYPHVVEAAGFRLDAYHRERT